MTLTTTLFPGRYLQGAGALNYLADEVRHLGTRVAILTDPHCAEHTLPRLQHLLGDANGMAMVLSAANTEQRARDCASSVKAAGCDVILGVGGGKAMDAAKATAACAHLSLIIVPSVASTDAPCSSVAVMQTEAGAFSHYAFLPRSPALVLVDTALILTAPLRMLVAGMGDALSTWFEAEESQREGWCNVAGKAPGVLPHHVARCCFDTVIEYGEAALQEAQARVAGPAFERIVEANILLSGIGFESGGLGSAHAIQNGLARLPECRGAMHGELVTLGLLAMLQLETYPQADLAALQAFVAAVGLPASLADLGLAGISDAALTEAAQFACTPAPMNRVAPSITPGAVLAALRGLPGRHAQASCRR